MKWTRKRCLYHELLTYYKCSEHKHKKAKQRYKELLSIIFNNQELENVIKYYKTLNNYYK